MWNDEMVVRISDDEIVMIQRRENGFCYWATIPSPADGECYCRRCAIHDDPGGCLVIEASIRDASWSGPICASPSDWPTESLDEARELLLAALA